MSSGNYTLHEFIPVPKSPIQEIGESQDAAFERRRELSRNHLRRRTLAARIGVLLAVSSAIGAVEFVGPSRTVEPLARVIGYTGLKHEVGQVQDKPYIVKPGDSLWEIATQEVPGSASTDIKVQDIAKINHLDGNPTITPHQELNIPSYDNLG